MIDSEILMRKIAVIIILIIAASRINAETHFDFSWNLGNQGFGINVIPENDGSIEWSVSVFNLIIEEEYRKVNLKLCPLKYWVLYELQDKPQIKDNGKKYSFLNAKMYWNLLDYTQYVFGPFAAINYMYVGETNGFHANEYIFSSGLDFSFSYRFKSYSLQVGAEAGYRNMTGKSNFYFMIQGDILPVLFGLGMEMIEQKNIEKSGR